MWEFLIKNNILSVIITVIGWVVVFILGMKQQKKHLRNTAKMKIYEEFCLLKKEIDKANIDLSIMLGKYGLPFLDMSFKKDKNNPIQANSNALTVWQTYVSKLGNMNSNFTETYLKLWNHSEAWIGLIPQLKIAKKELFEIQLHSLSNELSKHIQYLQNQSMEEFYWEKWSKEEIENKSDEVRNKFDEIACGYIDDYISLIHNRLISPIFGYKKHSVKTLLI